ncbi:unnamed protein product, partial [Prorocentrum cordatum]
MTSKEAATPRLYGGVDGTKTSNTMEALPTAAYCKNCRSPRRLQRDLRSRDGAVAPIVSRIVGVVTVPARLPPRRRRRRWRSRRRGRLCPTLMLGVGQRVRQRPFASGIHHLHTFVAVSLFLAFIAAQFSVTIRCRRRVADLLLGGRAPPGGGMAARTGWSDVRPAICTRGCGPRGPRTTGARRHPWKVPNASAPSMGAHPQWRRSSRDFEAPPSGVRAPRP